MYIKIKCGGKKRMDSKNLFTEEELYNLCLAQVSAVSVEKENGCSTHWSEYLQRDRENVEGKFDQLSETDQNEFECELKKVAEKFRSSFETLESTKDNKEEFINIQRGLVHNAAYELNEYLINR
jgi:hypothetical protein